MAANHHPSPPMSVQMHHGPPGPPPPPPPPQGQPYLASRQMPTVNEMVWIQLGMEHPPPYPMLLTMLE
jgi:hypothetical protein